MRPTILTVDDAKGLRLLVEKALSPFDCEATEAANGFNGFFAIERARPDLILLDISMPVMDGLEMLRRLKSTPEIADIPVIMLASRADHAVIPELPARGARDTLMKPFNEAALLEKIQGVIQLEPLREKS
jgi:two-component system, chemotaxis family, chemotaxis protein CheY